MVCVGSGGEAVFRVPHTSFLRVGSPLVILSEASRRFLSPEIVLHDFRSGRAVEEFLRRFCFYGCPTLLALSLERRF